MCCGCGDFLLTWQNVNEVVGMWLLSVKFDRTLMIWCDVVTFGQILLNVNDLVLMWSRSGKFDRT
jgi:hypothetical protein